MASTAGPIVISRAGSCSAVDPFVTVLLIVFWVTGKKLNDRLPKPSLMRNVCANPEGYIAACERSHLSRLTSALIASSSLPCSLTRATSRSLSSASFRRDGSLDPNAALPSPMLSSCKMISRQIMYIFLAFWVVASQIKDVFLGLRFFVLYRPCPTRLSVQTGTTFSPFLYGLKF